MDEDSYSSCLSHGWGLLLLMVSRKLEKWLWAHGLLDTYHYLYDGYILCLYMNDYLNYTLVNIVGWPGQWCYYRFHEDIAIWIHGDMAYLVT